MAWTQSDIDALEADIAALGAIEETQFGDQRARARKIEEALKLLATMKQAVGTTGTRTHRYAQVSKGV